MKMLACCWVVLLLGVTAHAEPPASEFTLSASRLSFVVDVDSQPIAQRVVLTTPDSSTRWVAKSDAPWLRFSPARGRGAQPLTLSMAPQRLPPGDYRATLRVIALDPAPSARQLRIAFTVHPRRGVSVLTGNDQTGIVGSELPQPLVAQVLDAEGKPAAGVAVAFATVVGSTEPMQHTAVSDANGHARFQPTLRQYGALGVTAGRQTASDAPAYFQGVVTGWTSTLAGDGVQAWGGDGGPAGHAQFSAPFGMALRGQQLLVVDYFNHALRAVNLASGVIEPLVGTARQGFNGDGLAAGQTLLNGPFAIALSPAQDIIFSDYYNNRIRVLNEARGQVSTVAGTGRAGYAGDKGPGVGAQLDVPLDIAADARGNIYVSDWHHHVVRKIDAHSGHIDTIAGSGQRGYSGEGHPRQVLLSTPLGLSVDPFGNLYIADYGNNRVRKIDAQSGLISTVAGSGRRGFTGDGGLAILAQLDRPYNVYADRDGGLFISDAGNHRVRHVDLASGVISTVAGRGEFGYSGDGGTARQATLKGPFSVIKDDQQQLYIAEYFGHRIRQVGPDQVPNPAAETKVDVLMRQSRQIFGPLPGEAASAANPLTPAKIALGRLLFHDERLSVDGTVSCASCHALTEFGVDGEQVSTGVMGRRGTRNAPSVFNAALQDAQFWDAREKTVESQAKKPLLNAQEMAMPDEAAVVAAIARIPGYRAYFEKAFPTVRQPITFTAITQAIAAFQRRLLTPDAPLDRFIAGQRDALSAQQLLGLEVFLREGCASCHAGPLLGGQVLHLLENYPETRAGTQLELRKRLGDRYTVKVSPLRNIAMTAPYLHDGRAATLAATLDRRLIAYMIREAGIRDTVDMTAHERQAMMAFLAALTGVIDHDYIAVPPLPL